MKITRKLRNSRGVALLIVLLVTTLLVAFIFEFAYGTRVSVNAAMNYRDSQRAYYLARSAVGYVWWNLENMPDSIPHNEWHVIPIISAGDTEVRVRWEDEGGKINVSTVGSNDTDLLGWLSQLFFDLGIDQEVLNVMKDPEHQKFEMLSELHLIMSDEDYAKTEKYFTMHSNLDNQVNVDTAPYEVLRSLLGFRGKDEGLAEDIVNERANGPITAARLAELELGDMTTYLQTADSKADINEKKVSKVHSFVTIGEYTKQIEAIIEWGRGQFTIKYWRAM
ncbi:MAG TPA: hypothetical protein DCO77_07390 [Nitrospiraceae bacterium]|nr:hypothetical protein [Nitrospiraceae bacterium]